MSDLDVQFIGMIRTDNISEIDSAVAQTVEATIDPDFVRDFARAHEAAGFDRVLIGYHSTGPDAWPVAAHAAAHTERLHMLVAHRPGFLAPTVAARAAVTLDHFTGGRVSLNIVTGGSDSELARDGDWSAKDARYRRTDEFLDIVRAIWTSAEPFDYEGEFYRVKNAFSDVKPLQRPSIPIYFGGASGAAVPVGAKHADVYMFWGEPLADTKARIDAVRAATPPGRSPAFSVSVRPILGATEAEAWDKAHDYLERIVAHRGASAGLRPRGRLATPARSRRARRGLRRPALDGDRRRHRRRRQYLRPGRHPGAGRGVAPALLRRRRHQHPHPRLRAAGGRRANSAGS